MAMHGDRKSDRLEEVREWVRATSGLTSSEVNGNAPVCAVAGNAIAFSNRRSRILIRIAGRIQVVVVRQRKPADHQADR